MIIIGQIISAFAKSGAKVAPFYYVYFKEILVLIFFIYYYQNTPYYIIITSLFISHTLGWVNVAHKVAWCDKSQHANK